MSCPATMIKVASTPASCKALCSNSLWLGGTISSWSLCTMRKGGSSGVMYVIDKLPFDVPGDPPADVSLHLMAADATPTAAVAGIDWATGRLSVIERRPGDGLVLRSSTLLDERVGAAWSESLLSPIDWSSVMFFHTDGAALGRDPAFIDNLLFLLLEQPRRSAG